MGYRMRRGGFGRGLGRRPVGIGTLLYRLPALAMFAAAGLIREIMRPNSLLRPVLLRLISDRRRRKNTSRFAKGTEVKATYTVVDEQPATPR